MTRQTTIETVLAQLCSYPAPAIVIPAIEFAALQTTQEIPAAMLERLRRSTEEGV